MTTVESYTYDNCIRERNNYYQNYEDALEEIARLKAEYKKLDKKYNELLSKFYGITCINCPNHGK